MKTYKSGYDDINWFKRVSFWQNDLLYRKNICQIVEDIISRLTLIIKKKEFHVTWFACDRSHMQAILYGIVRLGLSKGLEYSFDW